MVTENHATLPARRGHEERNCIVEANMGLPRWAVSTFAGRAVERNPSIVDDLVQAATIGLLRAAELWDETRGVQFSTYATGWMRQAIANELARTDCIIRLPRQPRLGDRRLLLAERRCRPLEAVGHEGRCVGMPADPNAPDPAEVAADRDEHEHRWKVIEEVATPRQVEALRRVAAGENGRQTGECLGSSKSNVYRLVKLARQRIREAILEPSDS